METSSNANIDKLCRTCLLESPRMVSLTTKMDDGKRSLNDLLLFVLNNKVTASPTFPQHVCGDCELLLFKLDEFKRRCDESDKFLKEILNVADFDSLQEVKLETPSNSDKESSLVHYLELNPININLAIKKDTNVDHFDDKKDSKLGVKDAIKEEFSDDFSDGFGDSLDEEECEDSKATFKCPCGKSYKSSKAYESHVSSSNCLKTGNNDLLSIPVKCERCNVVFKNTKAFKIHARIHKVSKRQLFSCTLCSRKFKNKLTLQSHLDNKTCRKPVDKVVKKEKSGLLIPVKCERCDIVFETMKLYKIHSQMHKAETPEHYQCSLCTRKFKKKSSLITHLKNHEDKDNVKYTCNICKREFKYRAHLDNHVTSEHNSKAAVKLLPLYPPEEQLRPEQADRTVSVSVTMDKKHSCKLCGKSFTMLSTLTDHMRTHTGERPFLCSVCGRGFSQKTNLAQHMRRHLGVKPFKCGECERMFVSKGELDAHTRKHSGAHPFVCDECGNGFTTSSSLRKHKRVHTGERPYACDLCPMKFAVSGTLKSHRRTHTGEKPYQCSYCEKAFVQRQDLVSHIRCHTGERPFVCAHCGQAFRKPSALKAHVKTHKAPPPALPPLQPLSLLHGLQHAG